MGEAGRGSPKPPGGAADADVRDPAACDAGAPVDDPCDRRSSPRLEVLWSVDCETEDTFLYAAITNISEMGIFVQTTEPLAVGTALTLRFAPAHAPIATGNPGGAPQAPPEPFVLEGTVQWVNRARPTTPNPGMGIRFERLTLDDRERIVESIRTIAYLREEPVLAGRASDPPPN